MFHSDHNPGSDSWYDDLESWMASEGIPATAENITVERERLMMERGAFIPGDYRFMRDSGSSEKKPLRKAS